MLRTYKEPFTDIILDISQDLSTQNCGMPMVGGGKGLHDWSFRWAEVY